MRAIVLALLLCSPCVAQWRVENVALYESPLVSDSYYRARGVPEPIREASLTTLWNGFEIGLLATQECAWSDFVEGSPWPGPMTRHCRGGTARVDFDLIVESPTTFRWEGTRSAETAFSFTRNGVSAADLPIWFATNELKTFAPGTYHLRAVAVGIDHVDQEVRLVAAIPVPEPSTAAMMTTGLLTLVWRRYVSQRKRL